MVMSTEMNLIDQAGRLVVTPNPVNVEGQQAAPLLVIEGESLRSAINRTVGFEIKDDTWLVQVDGIEITCDKWDSLTVKADSIIGLRPKVAGGKGILQLVAMVALTYVTFGISGVAGGAYFGASVAGKFAAMGVFMAGSMLINKVLGPKLPSSSGPEAGDQLNSITSSNNQARKGEAVGLLLGEVRVAPDLLTNSYAVTSGQNQYMNMFMAGGVNMHSFSDAKIGDAVATTYTEATIYRQGLSGMTDTEMPMYSNVTPVSGGELSTTRIIRTTPANTNRIECDYEYTLFKNDGGNAYVNVHAEYRLVGATAWTRFSSANHSNNKTSAKRNAFFQHVPAGQYEVCMLVDRVGDDKTTRTVNWTSLKAYSATPTDTQDFGCIGLRVRATGQLSGSVDNFTVLARAKPVQLWNGTAWVTATTRANGLSNPGAQILHLLRGVRSSKDGRLIAGLGLSDAQIDIEGLKAFMLHCTANGYKYDRWITSDTSIGDMLSEIALAGFGEFTFSSTGLPTVGFAAASQAVKGSINMANVGAGSFSATYNVSESADGVEVTFLNRETWEAETVQVLAPGKTTMLNPARINVEGITDREAAAKHARFHLAQNLYQYKSVTFELDMQAMVYRRLSVVRVSHDLTQWGYSGRMMDFRDLGNDRYEVTLDENLPATNTPYIGLRLLGSTDYTVFQVEAYTGEKSVVTIKGTWPAGYEKPARASVSSDVNEILWCADFKASVGNVMRVVSIEASGDGTSKASVTCVPETAEYWNYVNNGTYVQAPNRPNSVIKTLPVASSVRVSEQPATSEANSALNVSWEVTGDYEYAQLWAGLQNEPLEYIGNYYGNTGSIDSPKAGNWVIEVVPYNTLRKRGESYSVLYNTVGVGSPVPEVLSFTVTALAGGLRRFNWTLSKTPSLSGVKIRFKNITTTPTAAAPTAAQWDTLEKLAGNDLLYTSTFDLSEPKGGTYWFVVKAVSSFGETSENVFTYKITLDKSLDEQNIIDLTPPQAPSSITVDAILSSVTLSTNLPQYTVGGGHKKVIFKLAEITAERPTPTYAQATETVEGTGATAFKTMPVGKQYRVWALWETNAATQSTAFGPVTFSTSQIGNADLAADIDLASKLADGSIDASKLVDGSLTSTKFAPGLEPVGVVTELPTTKTTANITFNGELYTWDGSKYSKSVKATDITGTLTSSQIANNAVTADKIASGQITAAKMASGLEPVTVVTSLPTTKSTANVVFNNELYTWNGTAYSKAVKTTDLTGTITNAQIAAGAITANKFASGVEPVTVVTALPTTKGTTNVVFNNELYTWDGAAYSKSVKTVDLVGTITSDQIATGAVDLNKFANGIEPVAIVTTLPTTKGTESVVFNGELYTWNGTAYSKAVSASDITGTLVANQIASNAVTADKLASNAVTSAKLASNAVTEAKIASGAVSATKFASGIEPVAIVTTLPTTKSTSNVMFNNELYTWNGTAYTKEVKTVDLVGTVVENQIAAGAVTAAKLAANSVDSTKFASGIEPITVVPSLPTTKGTSSVVFNNELYTWNGSTYSKAVKTTDLSGSISASQLANNSVTADKIASGSITAAKMASGLEPVTVVSSLPTTKSTSSVVFNNELYTWDGSKYSKAIKAADITGTLSTTQIANNAITVDKIAAGAVTANELASGAVTVAKMASGIEPITIVTSLPTTKSTSSVMFNNELYTWNGTAYSKAVKTTDLTGTVSASQIANNAVTADKIAAGSISANKFASGIEPVTVVTSLPTTKSTSSVVFNNELYTWNGTAYSKAVKAADISGQLAAAQIAALEASKITGTITGTQIADNSISTGKIAANAITAAKIATGTITANELAANSVTTAKIATNAVTANEIATGTITANELAANSVTTAKIAAGAVTATEVAAKSITADKLVISNTTNLFPDPLFNNADAWNLQNGGNIITTTGPLGNQVKALSGTPSINDLNQAIPKGLQDVKVAAGEVYGFRIVARRTSDAAAGSVRIRVQFKGGLSNNNDWPVPAAVNLATATKGEWVTATGTLPTQTNRDTMTVYVHTSGATGVTYEVCEVGMFSMTTGELIVNGAVTADKIAANTITATQIAAGTISANELATNSVTTAKINAGAVTANEIASNAVTADKIAANSVTAAKIAAATITAAEIATGTITTKQLAVADSTNLMQDAESNTLGKFQFLQPSAIIGYSTNDYNGATLRTVRLSASATAVHAATYPDIPVIGGQPMYFEVLTRSGGGARWNGTDASKIAIMAGTAEVATISLKDYEPRFSFVKQSVEFVVPDGVTRLSVQIHTDSTTTGSNMEMTAFTLRKRFGGELIVDGAITADKIAANTITASKLVVVDGSTLIPDADYFDLAAWQNSSEARLSLSDTAYGTKVVSTASGNALCVELIATNTNWSQVANRNSFGLLPNKVYQVRFEFYSDGAATVRSRLTPYRIGGATGTYSERTHTVTEAGWTSADYQITTPADATTGKMFFYIQNNSVARNFVFSKVFVREATSAELIVDGAITTDKLTANSVTTAKIATNAVTANEINANAVTAAKIAANAVTADKISANAVTAAKISAGAITADKLAVNSVTAASLVVSDTTNLLPDPGLESLSKGTWYTTTTAANGSFSRYEAQDGVGILISKLGTNTGEVTVMPSNYRTTNLEDYIPVVAGTVLRTTCTVKLIAGASSGNVGMFSEIYKSDGTRSNTDPLAKVGLSGKAVGYTETVTGTYTVPDGVIGIRHRAYFGSATNSALAQVAVYNMSVRRVNEGNLIVDGAITTNHLTANSVTTAKIATNAVTANEIAANAVTADKIIANAVTTAKIAAGAVTAAEIAAGAITASKLTITDSSTLVPDSDYMDSASWLRDTGLAVSLAADSNGNTGTGSGRSAKTSYTKVTGGTDYLYMTTANTFGISVGKTYLVRAQVYSNAVSAARIVLRMYTAADVETTYVYDFNTVAGWARFEFQYTITSQTPKARLSIGPRVDGSGSFIVGKLIVREAVDTSVIVDGAITADKLVANAVTADKIQANAVTTAKINTGAVTANELASNSVTAVKVAANAITADKISANAVTTAKIAAGAVTATEIAAGSITAAKLAITDLTAINVDPTFSDPTYWNSTSITVETAPQGAPNSGNVLTSSVSVNNQYASNLFPIRSDKQYLLEFVAAQAVATGTGACFVILRFYDRNKSVLGATFTSSNSQNGNNYLPSASNKLTTAWTSFKNKFGAGLTGYSIPSEAVYASVGFYFNYGSGAVLSKQMVNLARITAVNEGELIVDGSIDADKLSAGAVTADKITANAVTTAKIAAGAVTANEIAANAVTADKIIANAVTTAKIATGAVTANEIAANTITAAKIAAGTISATQLASSAVTTDKLSANAVTAEKITTNAITADKISANAVTTAKIATNAVTSNEIAANTITAANIASATITATQLAANAVTADKITANAVTTAKINTGAVTANEIAANAVTADKIIANAVTTAKIATNAVTSNEIAANTITAANIASGTITANELAAGSVTAKQLVLTDTENLIQDANFDMIAEGAWHVSSATAAQGLFERYAGPEGVGVLMTKVGTYSGNFTVRGENWRSSSTKNFVTVTPGDVLRVMCKVTRKSGVSGGSVGIYADRLLTAGTVSGTNIGGYVTSQPLDETVVINKTYTIPAGTVGIRFRILFDSNANDPGGSVAITDIAVRRMNSADMIVDGAITTNKLAANSVTANAIAAGAVTANALAVMDFSTLVPDPEYSDTTAWSSESATTHSFVTTADGEASTSNGRVAKLVVAYDNTNSYNAFYSKSFPISGGRTYQLRFKIKTDAAAYVKARVQLYGSGQSNISRDKDYNITEAGWTEIDYQFEVPTTHRTARFYVYIRRNSSSAEFYVSKVTVNEATGATTIVNGAITTDKISANAITAAKIASGTITATQLAANAVTADKISAGAVTAAKLAANSIVVGTAAIQTGAITSAHIANLAADKITAGSLAVGSYLQSSNYVAGTTGWRIHANGTADMQGLELRGNIYASGGKIGAFNIGSKGIYSGSLGNNYAWTSAGDTSPEAGMHISDSGILFQGPKAKIEIGAHGYFNVPGLTVDDGIATLTQANTVNTYNVSQGAISQVTEHNIGSTAFYVSATRNVKDIYVAPEHQQLFWFTWNSYINDRNPVYSLLYYNDGGGQYSVAYRVPAENPIANIALTFYNSAGTNIGGRTITVTPGLNVAVVTEVLALPPYTARVNVTFSAISRTADEGYRQLNNMKAFTAALKR